jgi:hypothetical protein
MKATVVVGSVIVLLLVWTTFAITAQDDSENPSFPVTEAWTISETD